MTKQKNDMRKHYNRTKTCSSILKDIPIDTLLEELDEKTIKMTQFEPINEPELTQIKPNLGINAHNLNYNKYECSHCGKNYSNNSHLCRHLKTCKEKDKKEKAKQEKTSLEKEEIALMKQIIAQDKEEKDLLRKQIELLMNKIGNTNIENNNCNNTNNNTNNTVNIQINGWGEEDRSHLTDKFLRFCYDRPFTSIQRVIEAVFFNTDCPNNWNVMIKDDKSSKALIYDRVKDTWLKKETIGVVEDLMHTGYSILDENFDKQRDANKLTDRIIEKFTNFQDFYGKSDKEYEKRLITEIKELLINYKAYHIK